MDNRIFSTTLQKLRKEKKVTQEQLASCLGVSAQAVSKWENGSYPEGDLLPALADYFGVSIDVLYGRGKEEVPFNQQVFNEVYDCCVNEYQKTGRSNAHYEFAKLIKNILWAVQIGSWVNNRNFYSPPYCKTDDPKMASAVFDDVIYTYMGHREDNDFFLFLNSPEDKHVFEDLINDADRVAVLFKLLSDKDNIKIISYLYSLTPGEYAGIDIIAKEVGIDRVKVKKALDDMSEKIGDITRGHSPFQFVKVVNPVGESRVYGIRSVYGGLFMGLMMLAREYSNPPVTYQMHINAREKSWVDKNALKLKR